MVFNQNLWTDKGVYVVHNSEAKGLSEELDPKKLEGMLREGDPSVRFAPKDSYKLGHNTPDELAQNRFIIASYGEEGAKQLAEISRTFPSKPCIYGLDIKEGEEPEQRVSVLNDYNGDRLNVDCDHFDDDGGGHAFGLLI